MMSPQGANLLWKPKALRLLQSKSQRTAWFELPHASSGMDGFCDADNGMNWDLCGKFSSEEACEAKKSACKWSPGDPFPGFCGVRDDPASEMLCKKNTQPMDCVSSSCQWYRYPMGPGPVQWNHWVLNKTAETYRIQDPKEGLRCWVAERQMLKKTDVILPPEFAMT